MKKIPVMANGSILTLETMAKKYGSTGPERVIIFAECGLLAGDLAALLSGSYEVVRVTSVSGVRLALARHPGLFILVEGQGLAQNPQQLAMVQEILNTGTRMVVLGADPDHLPPSWRGKILHQPQLPEPQEFFAALQKITVRAQRAER